MAQNVETTLKFIRRQDEENSAKKIAKNNNLPYVDLLGYPVLFDILKLIPFEDSISYQLVTYLKTEDTLKFATNNPQNPQLSKYIEELAKKNHLKAKIAYCSATSIKYIQSLYEHLAKKNQAETKVEITQTTEEDYITKINNLADLKEEISKVPATKMMEILFAGAVASDASDIHLEPQDNVMRVRYRIDGVLQDIVNLPKGSEHVINSRIKYLAKLKLDIKDKPQDGRFEINTPRFSIDVRVSMIPSSFGETIVMRLLPKNKKFLTLENLGFRPEYIKIIEEAIKKPNGIVFNTGPTGSGKTTTNYAILDKVNKPDIKIVTLEDPIEYRIPGIEQSQVETDKGYTFASGLRSILRQDPDIIMVGEIRDEETATIAMQASMTGHLVLTTLHTNNAAGAIPRLLDIGVKPYLMGGTLNLIIAQRLVRKIHSTCQGKGCVECNMTGFKGRIAIAELLVPNPEIEKLILRNATIMEYEEVAKSSGMITMYEDGMDKVAKGLTTKEEVMRVTRR